jgi:hypothetical protein
VELYYFQEVWVFTPIVLESEDIGSGDVAAKSDDKGYMI